MRFRRTIIASLAPLIGLSALLTAATAEAGAARGARPLIRLLQTVVQLAAPAIDHTSAPTPQSHPSAQLLLAFAALAVTPLGHSLWMIARRPAVDLLTRRHLLVPLRC
jgi:hypothetical protein